MDVLVPSPCSGSEQVQWLGVAMQILALVREKFPVPLSPVDVSGQTPSVLFLATFPWIKARASGAPNPKQSQFRPRRDLEFNEHVVDVHFHGSLGDPERVGDLLVPGATLHHVQNVEFSACEGVCAPAARLHQNRQEIRIDPG